MQVWSVEDQRDWAEEQNFRQNFRQSTHKQQNFQLKGFNTAVNSKVLEGICQQTGCLLVLSSPPAGFGFWVLGFVWVPLDGNFELYVVHTFPVHKDQILITHHSSTFNHQIRRLFFDATKIRLTTPRFARTRDHSCITVVRCDVLCCALLRWGEVRWGDFNYGNRLRWTVFWSSLKRNLFQ